MSINVSISPDDKQSKYIEEIIERDNETELIKAFEENPEVIHKPLIEKAGITPLHFAATKKASNCVSAITSHLQNLNQYIDTPTRGGQTALHIAAENFDSKVIGILLEKGAYPNVRDDRGFTPLHYLAKALNKVNSDNEESINSSADKLLNCSSIDLDAISKKGDSPLEMAACQINSSEIGNEIVPKFCKKLIENGAKVSETVIDRLGNEFISTINVSQANQNMTQSSTAKMFNYLTKNEPQHVRKIWKEIADTDTQRINSIKTELSQAANKFYGAKRIFYYIVDKCNEEGVSLFLDEFKIDVCQKSVNGELPLHRALARSNYTIVDKLIRKMAEIKDIDLSDLSFTLIKKALGVEAGEVGDERSRCLERLFQGDIELNINQLDVVSNQTALHFAAAMNNQKAIEILIANGAYLGQHQQFHKDGKGTLLKAVMCKTLKSALDRCMSISAETSTSSDNNHDDFLSNDYSLQMKYKFLLPSYNEVSKEGETPHHSEATVLYEISQSKDLEEILKHPLIQVFLFAKWQRVMLFNVLNIIMYLLFVMFLTLFMHTSKDVRFLENVERNENVTDPVKLMEHQEQLSDYRTKRAGFMVIVLLFTLYKFCKEVFQILTMKFRSYFRHIENYLEWILIVVVAVVVSVNLSVETTTHLAAWAMIAAW